ncbi:MAG: hypothetical protein LBG97_10605 [Coriobacteriales bacterium]|jgi:hypothetical protein|nr:hypothetical protein [Coriobacteriales bacterium]
MPQVSLYLENNVLGFVRRKAKENKLSVSRYVSSVLAEKCASSWPHDYFSLFGALDDDSFTRPEQPSFADDAPRQQL